MRDWTPGSDSVSVSLRQAGKEAARLGFESLWTPAGGVPDAFHVCAAWAEDVPLWTGISVVPAARMWGPLALAAQAATVGQLPRAGSCSGSGPAATARGSGRRSVCPTGLSPSCATTSRRCGPCSPGETVTYEGPGLRLRGASLGTSDLPRVPIQLGALGPQMVRLAGELADGALLNWATPERIAESRRLVAEGAARAGRDPDEVALTMYIRVCVDDDLAAARRALGAQVLGYALGRPGTPLTAGYRGLFAQMGFGEVLSDLEERRSARGVDGRPWSRPPPTRC